MDTDDEHSNVITYPDGAVLWYYSGLLHRVDGPAHIEADGTQHWYVNGDRHRTDGPAIMYPDGSTSWYVNGCLRITDKKIYQLKAGLSDEDMVALILRYGDIK